MEEMRSGMHWFKPFLSLIIIIIPLIILCGCGLLSDMPGNAETVSASSELPEWLKLSHRQAGPLNFDYVPLDPGEIEMASGEDEEGNDEQETASTGTDSSYRPNPTGSPYAPGTLDDMIWQQKQRDKQ